MGLKEKQSKRRKIKTRYMAPSDGVVPQGHVLSHGNRFQNSDLIKVPARLTSVLEHEILGAERKMTQSKPVDRDNCGAGWTFDL